MERNSSGIETRLIFVGKEEAFKELKLVKPSRTKMLVVATVATFLLGSDPVKSFSKDEVIGEELPDVVDHNIIKTPLYDIKNNIDIKLKNMASKNPDLLKKNYISPIKFDTVPPLWNLVYDKLANNNDYYRLVFGAKISRLKYYNQNTLFGKEVASESNGKECTFKSEPLKLTEWKQNDYQKVSELKPKIVEKCLNIFIPFLPELTKSQVQANEQ